MVSAAPMGCAIPMGGAATPPAFAPCASNACGGGRLGGLGCNGAAPPCSASQTAIAEASRSGHRLPLCTSSRTSPIATSQGSARSRCFSSRRLDSSTPGSALANASTKVRSRSCSVESAAGAATASALSSCRASSVHGSGRGHPAVIAVCSWRSKRRKTASNLRGSKAWTHNLARRGRRRGSSPCVSISTSRRSTSNGVPFSSLPVPVASS
mmetsp:Transcript_29884/g.82046  ORF Transcript_29884/g.82046 Transcript_29884/m.82046 type:complete len:211 (-) Transcript_29884:1096-1728(-)